MKKIMPPTYLFVLLVLLVISHFIFPLIKLILYPYNIIGVILIIFGIFLNLWTDRMFKINKTTVKPDEIPSLLITNGPFVISRHPMYLGMLAILLGAATVLGSLVTFIFPIIFVIIMEKLFISLEEENLEKNFKNEFIEYKKRVRRWI